MKRIKIFFYSLWYGHKFERGYEYQRIRHTNLDLLEKHHYSMIKLDWVKDGDVEAGFIYAWCWYRRPNNLARIDIKGNNQSA